MPIFFVIIGFLCIASGFVFSVAINYNKDDNHNDISNKELATGITQENLTCLSEFHDDSNSYKVVNKIIYYFNDNKLKSSEMSTVISFINLDDISSIQNLTNNYKNLYPNSSGVTYNIYSQNDSLYFNRNINSYSLFDIFTYDPIISTLSRTNIFEGGESISIVKEKEILLGNSCS